jgi:hypothetical protein
MSCPLIVSVERALAVLRDLERHPACACAFLTHEPVTSRELLAMSSGARAARSRAAIASVQSTRGWQQAREAIRTLGKEST